MGGMKLGPNVDEKFKILHLPLYQYNMCKSFYFFACFRHGGISLFCTGLELYVHSETNSVPLTL